VAGEPSKRDTFTVRRDGEPRIVPTYEWSADEINARWRILRNTVRSVGDEHRWRLFRMNVTLCLHKALTAEEVALLPPEWASCRATALAGGPVEVLFSEGCSDAPSCQPCAEPEHVQIDPLQPELWLPADCGVCESCKARAEILPHEERAA
jgi:hypothetical protein